jgi:anti-sigma factor RsiW
MATVCDRYSGAIQELADGTLGPIRRAELEQHLEDCPRCRALAEDLTKIRGVAQSLDRPAVPDGVWLQIAGRLRQEGRVSAPPPAIARRHHIAMLAIAASLVIAVGAALYLLWPLRQQGHVDPAPQVASGEAQPSAPGVSGGNAAAGDPVKSVGDEFRLAEQHLQAGIAKLEEAAKADGGAIDPATAATLQKNLQIIDHAIAESRAALQTEPQSAPARETLFDALRKKVTLLQDTIALMNQMRKGDAAGAAQIVDGVNKS